MLIVQPEAGLTPTVHAIRRARKSIDIVIFRLDLKEVIDALAHAVARGVVVRALIAHTNKGGEKSLRKLEQRLLAAGVTVSRTADDLVRYHGKMMIVDGTALHIYGFNLTSLDVNKSRSFGIVTKNRRVVLDALKLFEADVARQPFVPTVDRLAISPENARDTLSKFLQTAKKSLWIYDPQVSDPAMVRLLAERAQKGVEIKIIGRLVGNANVKTEPYPGKRMHIRAILRDGKRAFLGSQSLRKLELDRRREIGVFIDEPGIIRGMQAVFAQDWALTSSGKAEAEEAERAAEAPKKDADAAGTAHAE